jgi:prepilin-type N-terminal cleavage/methylation domain-containing protein
MRPYRRSTDRRGVTLLEMLVVVALVVLMMLILASIFQAATGAMVAMRTNQELDDSLRLLDLTLRQDLGGVTAKMTPPNNPLWKSGYFEYGENAPADLQGEDTDDYLAFTTKAPEGRVFTGRAWIPDPPPLNAGGLAWNKAVMPVTITSKYAEVIYFLRNGNLYRRVLLVVPERRGAVALTNVASSGIFQTNIFSNGIITPNPALLPGGVPVGWYAVNDISARPNNGPDLRPNNIPQLTPIPNDLGDLTNRENRFARQRFANDFFDQVNGGGAKFRDGIADDGNFDLIPDYYPTLTWTQVQIALNSPAGTPQGLMNEDMGSMPGAGTIPNSYPRLPPANDTYAFPFIFPGMYSAPELKSLDGQMAAPTGWLHSSDPGTPAIPGSTAGIVTVGNARMPANQAPLDFGDSLAPPGTRQTWWGFPTFRETASIQWQDPVFSLRAPSGQQPGGVGQQARGLQSFAPNATPAPAWSGFFPPLGSMPPQGLPGGIISPTMSDGAGYLGAAPFVTVPTGVTVSTLPGVTTAEQLSFVWDDDLIMTGVRSFDVKALDLNAPLYFRTGSLKTQYAAGYYDLGYAASDYVQFFNDTQLVTGTTAGWPANSGFLVGSIFDANLNPQGFGHEGRMPPNSNDNRVDPQRPVLNPPLGANTIGDPSTGLNRLRRVWDSWSTDYTTAPAIDVNLRGSPLQPSPLDRPIYPSYPPPYPQALRGIQIQIRVVDPKNEKVKVLTIRQDFTNKL